MTLRRLLLRACLQKPSNHCEDRAIIDAASRSSKVSKLNFTNRETKSALFDQTVNHFMSLSDRLPTFTREGISTSAGELGVCTNNTTLCTSASYQNQMRSATRLQFAETGPALEEDPSTQVASIRIIHFRHHHIRRSCVFSEPPSLDGDEAREIPTYLNSLSRIFLCTISFITMSFMTLSFYDYLRGFPLLIEEISCGERVFSVMEADLEILGRYCGAMEVMIPNCEVAPEW